MRLLVVEKDESARAKWLNVVKPHWAGEIELVDGIHDVSLRLKSPYFFPLLVCPPDKDLVLRARQCGVQRILISPCEPLDVIDEISVLLNCTPASKSREAQVQLQVLHHTLNGMCHGTVTYRQLTWLKQRCSGEHLELSRLAIDQALRYMDRPNYKTLEIKHALLELSDQVQLNVDRVMALQYA